jgi:hypothetical protein
VRELCLRVWREQGWPQQSMGYRQWNALWAMICSEAARSPSKPITLPGGVVARRSDRFLLLERGRG